MRTMYVRFLGSKICYTVDDGRFYMGGIEEATREEIEVCRKGGGDLPLSIGINNAAQ